MMALKTLNDSPEFGETDEFDKNWLETPKGSVISQALKPSKTRHVRNHSMQVELITPKYNQTKFSFDRMSVRTRKRKGFKVNLDKKEASKRGRVPRFKCSKKPGFENEIESHLSELRSALRSVNRQKTKSFV